ncbi:RPL37A [Cordylochernes scorpioides]|uniref:RPL37A n=1 Tax=Cordylochernes scorpioides TaxID=51811 RepID=A0ABY6K4W2_9ARAC|nr:RPL37A [Cordylochernes scorpioides]
MTLSYLNKELLDERLSRRQDDQYIAHHLDRRTSLYVIYKILAPGFHRRVKAKTSFQDDDVPIDDDTTTKPLFTPQENGRKGTRDKVPRLRWNPWQKHVKFTSVSTIIASYKMAKRTKKVGVVGKYGTRLRSRGSRFPSTKKKNTPAAFAARAPQKRKCVGIWNCHTCTKTVSGDVPITNTFC